MTKEQLQHIISQGEGISTEFKKAKNQMPKNLFETVCAFLNRSGGTILLGVLDDGTVEGIDNDVALKMKKDIANLSNDLNTLSPSFLFDVSVVEYDGKTLINMFVPASSQVHRHKGKVYDRSADGDFELRSDEQIINMPLKYS